MRIFMIGKWQKHQTASEIHTYVYREIDGKHLPKQQTHIFMSRTLLPKRYDIIKFMML